MNTQLTLDEELTIRVLLNARINECWAFRRKTYFREELHRCVKLLRKFRDL